MAFSTMSDIVACLSTSTKVPFIKYAPSSRGNNTYYSLFSTIGNYGPGQSLGGATGNIPTNASSGALPLPAQIGTKDMYLGRVCASATTRHTLLLVDRLYHNSGLVTSTTTTTTINGPTINRYVNQPGNELWLEFTLPYTAGTSNTITVTYTNSAGVSGRVTSIVLPTTAPVSNEMVWFPLAAGDVGVNSIQSVSRSASVANGVFNLVIARRLAEISLLTAGLPTLLDFTTLGLPKIYPTSCLTFIALPATTGSVYYYGSVDIYQG